MKYITYNHPTLGEMKVPIDPPLRENMGGIVKTRPSDFVVGANSPLQYEVTRPSGDWRDLIFLPDKQYYPTFDTFACTNFAPSNSRKLQWKQKTGDEINISERAMAVLSGTKAGVGNYMVSDPDVVRKNGFILEKDWSNDAGSDSVTEWFKPIPKDIQKKAIHVNEQYEWVDGYRSSMQYHLKHTPLTVMIKAGSTFHDVCAVFEDTHGIWYLDSYPHNSMDNFLAITTQVPQAVLKIITKPMNTIYFVHITGTQEFGLLMTSPVGQMYVPASTDADLKLRGGVVVPLLSSGAVDYTKAIEITRPA